MAIRFFGQTRENSAEMAKQDAQMVKCWIENVSNLGSHHDTEWHANTPSYASFDTEWHGEPKLKNRVKQLTWMQIVNIIPCHSVSFRVIPCH